MSSEVDQSDKPAGQSTEKANADVSVASSRGKSRRLAMQAIYQWQMTGDNITDIKQQFFDDNNFKGIDKDFFVMLVSGVVSSVSELDAILAKYMPRSVESVDPVERAILRSASYEFINRFDVPYRVVLNEAVNISKEFCSDNSHAFVNAVLDKVAREVRKMELDAEQSS